MEPSRKIQHHWQLDVFKLSRQGAKRFFELSKRFPKEETYSLTDQGRRSSRSVSGQIAEAWRRRKYEAVFVNKLNESEGEGGETQVWIEYSVKCGYVTPKQGREIHRLYNRILGKLVNMGNNPDKWVLPQRKK